MINARAETVHRKPAYRGPFRYRRCLIPAEGFYEWRQRGSAKQPYCIRPGDSEAPLAFAGLWDLWTGPQGEELESCTIIVRAAEGPVATVHDRMPVVLDEEARDLWLDPSVQRPEAVLPVLDMRDHRELSVYPVSRRVNNPAHEGPDLMAPEDESGAAPLP
jgi:putative SOS response-associated peptidase YedK